MEIGYDKPKLEKYFDNYTEMQKKIGPPLTKCVKLRINQIGAATTFQEYLDIGLGKPHDLSGVDHGCYGISLTANYRLVVYPDADDLSSESLSNCKKVFIKGVIDYHGSHRSVLIP